MNLLNIAIIICYFSSVCSLISYSFKENLKSRFPCNVKYFQRTPSIFHFKASKLNSHPENNKIVSSLDLNSRLLLTPLNGAEIFSDSTFTSTGINAKNFQQWEQNLSNLIEVLRVADTKDHVILIYKYLLSLVSKKELDPLQITAFDVAVKTCAETLMRLHPIDTPITSLIDEITDIHLNGIEDMLSYNEHVEEETEDLNAKISIKEQLCYQFASLSKYIYKYISYGLSGAFDTTTATQDIRLTMWMSPILTLLQRRYSLFNANLYEERIEEYHNIAFNKLLTQISIEITPQYSINTINTTYSTLPSWEFAYFIQKILRNCVYFIDILELENKINNYLRDIISTKMHNIIKPLERIVGENNLILSENQTKLVERFLNIGQESIGIVLLLWQIRYNIVGNKQDTTSSSGSSSRGAIIQKDYLRPIILKSSLHNTPVNSNILLESIPVSMRSETSYYIQELSNRLNPDILLKNMAILAYAVRRTASEEFHALSTYNQGTDELPSVSRDQIYSTILSIVVERVLLTAEEYSKEWLYEVLLGFVALEETWAVREPRAAAATALRLALERVIRHIVSYNTTMSTKMPTIVLAEGHLEDLKGRIDEIELAFGMLLRLPAGEATRCRVQAFKSILDNAVADTSESGIKHLTHILAEYPKIADFLSVPIETAEQYVTPLRHARYEKVVSELFLNADVAASVPALSGMFEEKLWETAVAVGIPLVDAELRLLHLASAVVASFLQSILQDSANMGVQQMNAMLYKGMYIVQHPLVQRLQQAHAMNVLDLTTTTVVEKLGMASIIELIRILETVRHRNTNTMSASNSGSYINTQQQLSNTEWGSRETGNNQQASNNTELCAFLKNIQASLLNTLKR